MCNYCVVSVLLLATSFGADAFFMPVFVRKPAATPTAPISNPTWSAPQQAINPPQSTYKDYGGFVNNHLNQYQPVSMTPVQNYQPLQQYSYETAASMAINPYSQLQPMFHNVQMVPCLCPLTRDVIEQQSQQMQQQQQQANTNPTNTENSKTPTKN